MTLILAAGPLCQPRPQLSWGHVSHVKVLLDPSSSGALDVVYAWSFEPGEGCLVVVGVPTRPGSHGSMLPRKWGRY